MTRSGLVASLLCCSILVSAASAAAAASAPICPAPGAHDLRVGAACVGAGTFTRSARGSKAPPAYTSPLLKPAAAAIVKQRYESVQAGKPYPTPSETCWPMVAAPDLPRS